jgi:hypothetical protein
VKSAELSGTKREYLKEKIMDFKHTVRTITETCIEA